MKKLVLLLTAILFFTTCKKGEDDPAFTFQSRKARLEGDWNLKEGSASLTLIPYNEHFKFDGSAMNVFVTYTGGQPTIYTGNYRLTMSLTKDGHFTFQEVLAGGMLEGEGTWEFLGREDDAKNKERVQFTINNVLKGKINGTNLNLFHQQAEVFTYRLQELRKNKMVLVGGSKIDLFNNSDLVNFQAEYTMTQER